MINNFTKNILKEPIVHFLLIGTLIFLLSAFFEEDDLNNEYVIEISRGDVETMVNRWLIQLNRPPSEAEFKSFIDNIVREEILYREAMAMGLDNNDVIIKRRMVQKIEFLTNDLLDPPTATDEVLKNYLNDNIDRYVIPDKIDFIHIFYNPEKQNESDLLKSANDDKEKLNSLSDIPSNYYEMGDVFLLSHEFTEYSQTDVLQKFGSSDFSAAIFNDDLGKWIGPYLSSYGYHLVFVSQKTLSVQPDYESIKDKLKTDFSSEKRNEANERFMTELKKNYTVFYSKELKAFADSINVNLDEEL